MAKKPVSYLAGSVLLGTAIGAVVGLLAAPRSGRDTRATLQKRASDAGRAVPEQWSELTERGREAIGRLPGLLRRRKEASRSQVDDSDSDAITIDVTPLDDDAPRG